MKNNIFPIIFSLIMLAALINVSANMQHHTKSQNMEAIKFGLERAYFEGQKDAINGDVRIELNSDSVYVWTRSPWNDGTGYLFVPSKEDTN